jgi:hypothetical protein
MLTVLSLGAGVQSTCLALMAAKGLITPMPDCAIFADTGWEPERVYKHLAWLQTMLPFPVHIVSRGNIREDITSGTNSTGQRFASVPWFILSPEGKKGMGRRQCTKEYKLQPILRKVVELNGGKRPKGGTSMLIGISTDEVMRMRPSRVQYVANRHPLIELGMSRQACLDWMAANGYPLAPKSSCIGCPFRSDAQWADLRDNAPEEWADAVAADREIRDHPRMKGQQFMHAARVPLDEVVLKPKLPQPDQFNNECEGMCGV